ncbi:deoxyribonuclease-1-like [Tubulanus polymorphus]|uniref:deoxyribonuclease-1-like n=1 Tax=Tubulanus polymorphus TaxID=672921 RepID=UPI003DA5141C
MELKELLLVVCVSFSLFQDVGTSKIAESAHIRKSIGENSGRVKWHANEHKSLPHPTNYRLHDDLSDLPKLAEKPFKVAAFNVRKFGMERMKKPHAIPIISEVVLRNDITLIVEVQDSKDKAIWDLLKIINKNEAGLPYDISISDRVGRSKNKEQYAFIYRTDRVTIADTYQYEDNGDGFERPPFSVRVTAHEADVEDFALIATHTRPDDVVNELNNLTLVYEKVRKMWDLEDIMILGDFNADCDFLKSRDWPKVTLSRDHRFYWLLDNCADTTTGNTDCAYDRFVVAGVNLQDAVVPGLTNIYRFDEIYNLNDTEVYDVSDHYPIEMGFIGKKNPNVVQKLDMEWSFSVTEGGFAIDENRVRDIYRKEKSVARSRANFLITPLKIKTRYYEVRAERNYEPDVMGALKCFQRAFPGVISNNALSVVSSNLNAKGLASYHSSPPYVYGLDHWLHDNYDITVACRFEIPITCKITVSVHTS